MELKDIFLGPFFLVVTILLGYLFRGRLTNKYNRRYFIPALLLKLFGVLFFSLVYQFYYGGGDTFAFHHDTGVFFNTLLESPTAFFKMMNTSAANYTSEVYSSYISKTWLFKGDYEWNFVRFMVPLSILTFNTYLGISFLLGFYTFIGTWKIYQLYIQFHPQTYKVLPWAIFTIPSCIFWASGLLKDTLCLGAIGYFAYYSVQIIYFRKNIIWSLFWVLVSTYILQSIKYHIVLTFIPGLLFWALLTFQKQITNGLLKALTVLFTVAVASGFLFLAGGEVVKQLEQSAYFEEVQFKMQGFQFDHGSRTKGHGGGDASTYTLGELGSTDVSSISGILQSVPAAINVTLFRPYPWEVTKVVTLLSSVESLAFLLGTLFVLFRGKIIPVFTKAVSTPEVVMGLGYALILGFVVGFISFNFGVLTRFKTPLLPFYTASLVVLYFKATSAGRPKKKRSRKVMVSPN